MSFGWDLYFPWYPMMPPMTIPSTITKGNKYTKNSNIATYVQVFKQAIKINGDSSQFTKIVCFKWTLKDLTLAWGDNFMNSHPKYTFDEFAQTFYKQYHKV
jgi:hypothetical protein